MNDSKVLILAGMHRSGTSLMAHYLSRCGLNIGDNLFNPHIISPEKSCAGHHEDLDFIDFHKQIFRRHKIDSSALLIQESNLPISVNSNDRDSAIDLLKSRSRFSQWAWKDPRTTLFLDFWHDLIKDAYYIFLLRHPLSVVDSLVRRGNEKPIVKKPILGLRSWKIYNQEILKFIEKNPSISLLCDIDDLIASPETLSKQLKILGFDLIPSNLDEIFSQKAFHSSYSESVKSLSRNFPEEVAEAEIIYKNIKSLSMDKI